MFGMYQGAFSAVSATYNVFLDSRDEKMVVRKLAKNSNPLKDEILNP